MRDLTADSFDWAQLLEGARGRALGRDHLRARRRPGGGRARAVRGGAGAAARAPRSTSTTAAASGAGRRRRPSCATCSRASTSCSRAATTSSASSTATPRTPVALARRAIDAFGHTAVVLRDSAATGDRPGRGHGDRGHRGRGARQRRLRGRGRRRLRRGRRRARRPARRRCSPARTSRRRSTRPRGRARSSTRPPATPGRGARPTSSSAATRRGGSCGDRRRPRARVPARGRAPARGRRARAGRARGAGRGPAGRAWPRPASSARCSSRSRARTSYVAAALREHPDRFAAVAVADAAPRGASPGWTRWPRCERRRDGFPFHGLRTQWLGDPAAPLADSPMLPRLRHMAETGLVLWTYLTPRSARAPRAAARRRCPSCRSSSTTSASARTRCASTATGGRASTTRSRRAASTRCSRLAEPSRGARDVLGPVRAVGRGAAVPRPRPDRRARSPTPSAPAACCGRPTTRGRATSPATRRCSGSPSRRSRGASAARPGRHPRRHRARAVPAPAEVALMPSSPTTRSGCRAPASARSWTSPGACADPVIGLHVGEPSFATPEHVLDGARRALDRGETRYVANAGIPALREAIAGKVAARNGLRAEPGAGRGLRRRHAGAVRRARRHDQAGRRGARARSRLAELRDGGAAAAGPARRLPAAPGERLPARTSRSWPALVTERTRALLVNFPSNPLGAVLPAELAEALCRFADRHDLWLISDECYDEITFGAEHGQPRALGRAGPRAELLQLLEDLRDDRDARRLPRRARAGRRRPRRRCRSR